MYCVRKNKCQPAKIIMTNDGYTEEPCNLILNPTGIVVVLTSARAKSAIVP